MNSNRDEGFRPQPRHITKTAAGSPSHGSTTCNPDLIEDFLADRLSDAQQADFEQHLNDCDSCCAALHQRTADPVLWNDARSYLSSTDNAEPLSGLSALPV
jgi:hypothetical protein